MEKIIVFGSAIFVILFLAAENIMIKRIGSQLSMYILNRQFEEADKLRHKWFTKYLFKPFNLLFMDLNAAILKGDQQETDECFAKLEKIRMNKKQKMMVYNRGFYYYVLTREKEKAKRYYYLLCDGNEENAPKDVLIFYNTFVEEEAKYLDDVLDMLNTCEPERRADLESILSKMYENKKDGESAEKYRKSAEQHFNELEKTKKVI